MSYYFHFAIFLVPLFFMESVRIWLLLFSMESFELLYSYLKLKMCD